MLYATYRQKTHLPQYLYAKKNNIGTRRTPEDEITSIIFGSLDWMPNHTAYRLWKHLVNEDYSDPIGWTVRTELWPKTGGVEPDVKATLTHSGGEQQTIVVEVKWDAPLHERQLLDQWEQAFNPEERLKGHHVFIGKTKAMAESVGQWHQGLQTYTWLDFIDALKDKKLTAGDAMLKRWVDVVVTFLHASGIRLFRGFNHLILECNPAVIDDHHGQVFWGGWKGWENLPVVDHMFDINFSTNIFFTEGVSE